MTTSRAPNTHQEFQQGPSPDIENDSKQQQIKYNHEEPSIQIEDKEINPDTAAVTLENETEQGDTNSSIGSSTIECLDELEMEPRQIRILPNNVLIDIVNELNIEQDWRKKSELTCYDTLRRRAD